MNTSNQLIETLITIGGKRWTKNSYDRIYFNASTILDLQGIEYDTYKTGNVSWNNWGSNGKFTRYLTNLQCDKHFYDIVTGKWHGFDIDVVKNEVESKLAEKPAKNKKHIMIRAWEIAREAVSKFGGKIREYFAMSLKMAWGE